jgi:hypothetical protein
MVVVGLALAVAAGCGGTAPTPANVPLTPYDMAPTPRPTPSLTPTPLPTTAAGFSATGSMNAAGSGRTATLLSDGRVLIVGGLGPKDDGYPVLASAELYDPKTGSFSLTGSMNAARMRHTATLLSDGRVLIVGGFNRPAGGSTDALASAELYDPKTGSFSPTGSMATARYGHAASLLSDGRVLVSGGSQGGDTLSASAELYDPNSGTFSPTGSMTTARDFHTSIVLFDGRVFIGGGEADERPSGFIGPTPRPAAPWAELYDPTSNTFRPTGSPKTARDNFTATLLPGGRVLIAGGSKHNDFPSFSPAALASAELYDPTDGTFRPTGTMTVARDGHTATLLSDGRVLVAGGASTFVASAIYTIRTPVCSPRSDRRLRLQSTPPRCSPTAACSSPREDNRPRSTNLRPLHADIARIPTRSETS